MGDNTIIKVGAVAVAGYVAYTQGWLSFLGIGTSSTTATTTPATTTSTVAATKTVVADPNAITGANTLAGVEARTIAAAHTANAPTTMGVYDWNYYLNQVLSPMGMVAPGPVDLFKAAVVGFDKSQLVTSGQYFEVMGPALKSQLGLQGLGLYWVTQ